MSDLNVGPNAVNGGAVASGHRSARHRSAVSTAEPATAAGNGKEHRS